MVDKENFKGAEEKFEGMVRHHDEQEGE